MSGNEPMSGQRLSGDLGDTPEQAWTLPTPAANLAADSGARYVPVSPADLSWGDPADEDSGPAPRRALPPQDEPLTDDGVSETSLPLRGGLLPVKASGAMGKGWVAVKPPKEPKEGEGFKFPLPIGGKSRGLSSNSPSRAYEDAPVRRFQPRWLWISGAVVVVALVAVAVYFVLVPRTAPHPTPARPTAHGVTTAPITPRVSAPPNASVTPRATSIDPTKPTTHPTTTRKVLQDLVKNPEDHVGESFRVYGYVSYISDDGMKMVTWVGPEKSKATTQYKATMDHPYLVEGITEAPSNLKVSDMFSADAVVGNPVQGNGKKFALLQLTNVKAYGSAK